MTSTVSDIHELKVPIIDLDRLNEGDNEELSKLAYGLGDLGLIHIKNHGIDPSLTRFFYEHFQQFCSKPRAEKESLSQAELWFQRGWTPRIQKEQC